jgi:hypothetical protein
MKEGIKMEALQVICVLIVVGIGFYIAVFGN